MRKPRQVTSRASGKSRWAAMTRRRLPPAVRPVSMPRPKTAAAAAADVADKPTTCCRNSGAQSKMQNSIAIAMVSATKDIYRSSDGFYIGIPNLAEGG